MYKRHRHLIFYCIFSCVCSFSTLATAAEVTFELTFDPALRDKPFTGRVLFFTTKNTFGDPPARYNWLSKEPLFSADVRDWKPGESISITKLKGYPDDFEDLTPGKYRIRAVMHTNIDLPHAGDAPGNLQSRWTKVDLDPAKGGAIKLKINRRIPESHRKPWTERAIEVRMRSERLSKFHKRDIFLQALVLPPAEYDEEKERHFPAIYIIPGFGGDHHESLAFAGMLGNCDVPFVRVCLDPTTPLGHSVFADSDNNGPWGAALTEEFIPYIEKQFRLIPEPRGRFVTGHSSGGWSSLWLQVNYPDVFGGCWSGSPDPVDFHDFCGINLYATDVNFYRDAEDEPWPVMRRGDKVMLTVERFARLEDVMGPGGQLGSFEAVFGTRAASGLPRRLYDRKTGVVDPQTVKEWERYDIVKKLKDEWSTLGPKLAGKITVVIGSKDTFYLDGAARLLKRALRKLHSDARIIIVPDADHSSVIMSAPYQRMMKEMGKKFQESEPVKESKQKQPSLPMFMALQAI